MPRTSSRTSSVRKSSSRVSKVRKLESKMNQEQKKAQKCTQNLKKIKKDLIQACRSEIKDLKGKPFASKSTKAYKNTQKKIRSLSSEIKQCRKPKVFKA